MLLLPLMACLRPAADSNVHGDSAPDWYDGSDSDTDTDADSDSDSDADADTDTDADCWTTIKSTLPTTGSVDAYYRTTIEFDLTDADPSAEIEASVAGNQEWRGDRTLVFTPDEPLDPETNYSATLHYCGGDAEIEFSTSELGYPLEDPADLVGRTYALDLQDARVVEPEGIGALLAQYLRMQPLLTVLAEDGDSLDLLGAQAVADEDPPAQDFCTATVSPGLVDFADTPYFSASGDDVTFTMSGYVIEMWNLELNGTFGPDGSYIGGIHASGIMDTRPLDPLVSDDAEEGALCGLMPSFGAECEDCPGDGAPYCMTVRMDSVNAEEVRGLSLVEIDGFSCEGCESWSADDVPDEADRVCEDAPDNTSASCAVVSAVNFGAIALSLLSIRRRKKGREG